MIPLFIERITRPEPNGAGYEQYEQRYRRVLQDGREIAIEAGKRAEFDVPSGTPATVYVMEGAVRFEGDDTAAGPGDVVQFRPASEQAFVGVQADTPFRGVIQLGDAAAR